MANYKVKLVYYDVEENIVTESVWASKEGEFYRIKNVPFAPNLAYDDLISVEHDSGELFFDSLIETSGHSTIQMMIFKVRDVAIVIKDLLKLNCSWEGSHLHGYISVDVPKEVDYSTVREYLSKKRSKKILDFQEACLSHNV